MAGVRHTESIMQTLRITNSQELEDFVRGSEESWLFRGQTRHYTDDRGEVSIPTSFQRHGCIPPVMFAWTHYSRALIRAFSGMNYHEIDLGTSQAILQHYGWRSFFVDLTKSFSVAGWFAANRYSESKGIEMCENFEEEPVWLVVRNASYEEVAEPGNVYVIDRTRLESHELSMHDLTEFEIQEGTLRFDSQKACLVEGKNGKLPPDAVIYHLVIEHNVLVEYCSQSGLSNVEDVFPKREHDFVLQALLDIPWELIRTEEQFPIPAYRRGLELPEYDHKFVKHLGPYPTLFSGFWVADNRGEKASPFVDLPFFRLPKFAYFANTNDDFEINHVTALVNRYEKFVVELDGLINVPEVAVASEFEKGIYVERLSDGNVAVSGLVVHHPGHVVSGVGVNAGWVYKLGQRGWLKQDHPEQCPCNNDLRHILQFAILRHLNEALKHEKMSQRSALDFVHNEVEYA